MVDGYKVSRREAMEMHRKVYLHDLSASFLIERKISISAVKAFLLGIDSRPTSVMFNRLVFPVVNHTDTIVAYQSRALLANQKPKYWHSPGDWKGKTLYGLWQSIDLMLKYGVACIWEGNVDVISAWQENIPSVAPMGSALQRSQALLLRRYTNRAIIITDEDRGGEKARGNWAETLTELDFKFTHLKIGSYSKTAKDFNDLVVADKWSAIEQIKKEVIRYGSLG